MNYSGNKEYFELKRKLLSDSHQTFHQLPLAGAWPPPQTHAPQTAAPLPVAFIYEWIDDGQSIWGFGCDASGTACRLPINVAPGLFVVSANTTVLLEMCRLHDYGLITYNHIKFDANNFAVHEVMLDEAAAGRCTLAKIVTRSTHDASRLYYSLKKNDNAFKYAFVSQYWDATKFVMFEMYVLEYMRRLQQRAQPPPPDQPPTESRTKRRRTSADVASAHQPSPEDSAAFSPDSDDYRDFRMPQTVQLWIDPNLRVHRHLPPPTIPIITFDIETVSSDPHRVPDGSHVDDILFTVSIHHVHTNVLYTLVYLPLPLQRHQPQQSLQRYAQTIRDDGYDIVPDKSVDDSHCRNELEVFCDEYSLLERTMRLLTLDGRLHYLVGYNSMGYDIKYLVLRCAFYKLHMQQFIWRDGYCFGWAQVHLDLFRIVLLRYRLPAYSLNEVSKVLLKDSKTGVSAVALRFTFYRMYKHQRYFAHDECSAQMPSVRDTLHYNNADTLLVSKLIAKTQPLDFFIERAMKCQMPLSNLNTNYNKMQAKLWMECFVVGLNDGVFLGAFSQQLETVIKCPFYNVALAHPPPLDYVSVRLNLTDQLTNSGLEEAMHKCSILGAPSPAAPPPGTSGAQSTAQQPPPVRLQSGLPSGLLPKKNKFPGGANFCLGEFNVDNVQIYDYVTAYPMLIDRMNISNETASILPANVLLMLCPFVRDRTAFHTYDYMTHHGSTKSETNILYYQYIYDKLYCGGEFEFCEAELSRRTSAPVMVVWTGKRGILSRIITVFNRFRMETKLHRKTLDGAITMIEEKINCVIGEQLELRQLLAQSAAEEAPPSNAAAATDASDFFDYDDDDDDDVDDREHNKNAAAPGPAADPADECFGFDDDDDDADDADDGDKAAAAVTPDEDAFGLEDSDADEAADTLACTAATAATADEPAAPPTFRNPFGYKFACALITVYENKACVIDERELAKCADPVGALQAVKDQIFMESYQFESSYRMQKSIVSSIYGCIGKMTPVVAALITCTIRSTLLQTAQFVRELGYHIYYIDTDSLMISRDPSAVVDAAAATTTSTTTTTPNNDDAEAIENLSPLMNQRYPHTEMEMKVCERCMFVQKKTYYKIEDGCLKYGQHINGPQAWNNFVQYFYNQKHITTNDHIYDAFRRFFDDTYATLLRHTSVTPDFLRAVTQTIKLRAEYVTNTVAARFREYLHAKYPAIAGSNKQSAFYYMDSNITLPTLRPELDLQRVDDLRHVNLFKYYQNMFKTVFNVIKFHVRQNNEPYSVTISSEYVLLIMLKAFLDAYLQAFPHLRAAPGEASRPAPPSTPPSAPPPAPQQIAQPAETAAVAETATETAATPLQPPNRVLAELASLEAPAERHAPDATATLDDGTHSQIELIRSAHDPDAIFTRADQFKTAANYGLLFGAAPTDGLEASDDGEADL